MQPHDLRPGGHSRFPGRSISGQKGRFLRRSHFLRRRKLRSPFLHVFYGLRLLREDYGLQSLLLPWLCVSGGFRRVSTGLAFFTWELLGGCVYEVGGRWGSCVRRRIRWGFGRSFGISFVFHPWYNNASGGEGHDPRELLRLQENKFYRRLNNDSRVHAKVELLKGQIQYRCSFEQDPPYVSQQGN